MESITDRLGKLKPQNGNSSSRGSSPGRPNPQPVVDFTEYINERKGKYIGRDGHGEERPFIPEEELSRYWSKGKVNEICKAHNPHLTIKFDVVSKLCLRLFSILVYLDKVQYFDILTRYKISDAQLPLPEVPPMLNSPAYEDVVQGFLKHQWLFCPLVLNEALFTNLHLHSDHILPFHIENTIKDGKPTRIVKIKVNRLCDRLNANKNPGTDDPVYVLKSCSEKQYHRHLQIESKALTTLQQSGSEHIVGYYGSFIQSGVFNLLLQYADGGNLLDYFAATDPPKEPEDIRRFWKSFVSITKGLHSVHQLRPMSSDDNGEYRGIHQDIKPDNIILKKDGSSSPYGFLPMLADFGHSHFRVATGSEDEDDDMGMDRQGNQTYGAPEASRHARYLLNLPGKIPTAADIFSMGCVMSDAAAWVAFGFKGREMYRDLRISQGKMVESFEDPGYWDCFHDALERSKAVDDMHGRIRNECGPNDAITPQVLQVVEEHMLLMDHKDRLTAKQLNEVFVKLLAGSGESNTSPWTLQSIKRKAGGIGIVLKEKAKDVPKALGMADRHQRTFSDDSTAAEGSTTDMNDAHLGPASPFGSQASPALPPRPGPSTLQQPQSHYGIRSQSPRPHSEISTDALSPFSDGASSIGVELDPPTPANFFVFDDLDTVSESEISLQEAHEWREHWKTFQRNDPDKHRIVRSLQNSLRGRDHIFFIDDSRTMKRHSKDIELAFETLAYIVKPQDSKGWGSVSLVIGSTRTGDNNAGLKVYTDTNTSPLVKNLRDQCTYDRMGSLMEDIFSDLTDQEIFPRLPQGTHRDNTAPSSGSGGQPKRGQNPVSLIVLTDGRWGSGVDGAGLQHPIEKLMQEIKKRNLKRTQVMIQFIRFGDDEDGKRHLHFLAKMGVEHKCDIVDTRSINGNVCAMLIGSISHARRPEIYDEGPATGVKDSVPEAGVLSGGGAGSQVDDSA